MLTFSRDTPCTPADEALIHALNPHYITAYRNWHALKQAADKPLWLLDGLEALGSALVLVDGEARVRRWTPTAEVLLARYFKSVRRERERERLPIELTRWVKAAVPEDASAFVAPRPWAMNGEDGTRLTIRLTRSPRGPGYLLLLAENSALPTPEQLQARWGLPPQRATVLHLLTRGMTNAQIAQAMGLAPGTIRKHLEYTYRTLGVSTRSAAVSKATCAAE